MGTPGPYFPRNMGTPLGKWGSLVYLDSWTTTYSCKRHAGPKEDFHSTVVACTYNSCSTYSGTVLRTTYSFEFDSCFVQALV